MYETPTRAGHLEVRGLEMAFRWYGPLEGRPFLLVHGFTGSSDDFSDHVEALAELGPTVLVDLRGHGDSTNLGEASAYSIDELVEDLAAALESLEIEKCDLLGHSMGGMATLHFALRYPEKLHSLVLMDTTDSPIDIVPPEQLEKLMSFVEKAGSDGLLQVAAAPGRERAPAQLAYEDRVGSELARGRIEKKLRAMDPAAFIGFGRSLGNRVILRDRLGEIECPTLVMVGVQDRPFIGPSHAMVAGIRDAHLAEISDAAHSPQLENPDEWIAQIRAHLERARS
ncbi:MAG: alpha/beta fold hydrolase [bacterium]|nr:alpha/beta fold hydrolase [bacterium]